MKNFNLDTFEAFLKERKKDRIDEFEINGDEIKLKDSKEKIKPQSVWASPSSDLIEGTRWVISGRKEFTAPNATRPSVCLSVYALNSEGEAYGEERLVSRSHLNGYDGEQEEGEVFEVSETYMKNVPDMQNVIGEKKDAKGNSKPVYGKVEKEFARLKVVVKA